MIYITDKLAREKSTFVISCTFTDEDDNSVTPDSFAWSLVDSSGNAVNGLTDQSETPAATINIVLDDDDLQILSAEQSLDRVKRSVVIEATYTSSNGSGLPLNEEIVFVIENLQKIS